MAAVVKNPPANAGDAALTPGSGRSLGEGHGNLLQYSCLETPMDRGAWWTTVYGVAELDTTQHSVRLSASRGTVGVAAPQVINETIN